MLSGQGGQSLAFLMYVVDLISHFTYLISQSVCRGLFEKHKSGNPGYSANTQMHG